MLYAFLLARMSEEKALKWMQESRSYPQLPEDPVIQDVEDEA
jgi:hypothetical protein